MYLKCEIHVGNANVWVILLPRFDIGRSPHLCELSDTKFPPEKRAAKYVESPAKSRMAMSDCYN